MDRLLVGTPQRSDGSLTVAAPAREAGVSRASAYRAGEVLELFRQRVDERSSSPDVPANLRERIRELQGELREAHRASHEESIDLRRSVDTLAQRVPALALDNERQTAVQDALLVTARRVPASGAPMAGCPRRRGGAWGGW